MKARVPALRPADARRWLEWAAERKNWTIGQWNQVIWSDECSVARGKTGCQEWVLQPRSDKWKPYVVQERWYRQEKISQMFWAGVSQEHGRTDLVVMEGDKAA